MLDMRPICCTKLRFADLKNLFPISVERVRTNWNCRASSQSCNNSGPLLHPKLVTRSGSLDVTSLFFNYVPRDFFAEQTLQRCCHLINPSGPQKSLPLCVELADAPDKCAISI